MNKKAWIIFAAVCVAVLGALVYTSNKNRINVSDVDANKPISASEQSGTIADHVFGKADSKVVLVEYGDFQCPGCGSAHPTVKALSEKYKDQLAFVFRNFPLTSIHPNAKAAAAAAEAAGLQGKYWEMHNQLFEYQAEWQDKSSNDRTDFFASYAKQFNLNVDTFKTDMTSANVTKKISYDQAVGKKVDVSSTPTFFLNGARIEQPIWSDEAKFEEAIVTELTKQGIELPKEEK